MPVTSEKPMAAGVADSGIVETTSASTGASLANILPQFLRTEYTICPVIADKKGYTH